MDVIKAILNRHSVRDFSSKPVPKEIIMKIMEVATRSPSGGNSQPWEVFVATGETIERIRKRYLEAPQGGRPGSSPALPDYIQERMKTIRYERLKLLGLDPDDPTSANIFTEWSRKLFGAPVLVVICMDKALSSNLDIGLFVQSVCLAAQGYEVDSLIAMSLVSQHDVLRQELNIPDSLNIIIGIALGFANKKNIINKYRSPRRPLQEVVRYKD